MSERFGKFQIELNSDWNYYKGTIVKIDGVRYSFVRKIINAISPILEEECKKIKEEHKDD